MNKIFSGKNSEKLWEKINQVKMTHPQSDFFEDVIWEALYALGCKCQELESLLTNQSSQPDSPDVYVTATYICPDCGGKHFKCPDKYGKAGGEA